MKRLFSVHHLPGSSLIEILIATLVVGLVITAVAFLMSMNVKNNAEAEFRAQATVFAQQGVDIVRNNRANQNWTTFTTPASGVPSPTNPRGLTTSPGCTSTTLSFASVTFTRVCYLSGTGNSRTLTVIVTWPGVTVTGTGDTATTTGIKTQQVFYNR